MKSPRATPLPDSVTTGRNAVPFPDLAQTILGAVEVTFIPPAQSPIYTGNDLVLYAFTPLRIRMNTPGSAWLACEAHTALLIPMHSGYHIDTTGVPQGSHHAWFSFDGLAGHPAFKTIQNETGIARFLDREGTLGRCMTQLVARVHGDVATAFWPLQYQGRAMLAMLRDASRIGIGLYDVRPVSRKLEAPMTARVIDYLQKHLPEPVDLLTIAHALHVSRSTLSHSYKLETGETPLQTLRRLRVHRMKALLLENFSVAAIAEMTGFYDAHHASREFKRTEGLTPTEFLRHMTQK